MVLFEVKWYEMLLRLYGVVQLCITDFCRKYLLFPVFVVSSRVSATPFFMCFVPLYVFLCTSTLQPV